MSCAAATTTSSTRSRTTDYYALAGIFRSTDLCAGLRNKMGGGGLDYYDTADAAVRSAPTRATDAATAEKIEKREEGRRSGQSRVREASATRPKGDATRPRRPPEATAAPAEDEPAAARTART